MTSANAIMLYACRKQLLCIIGLLGMLPSFLGAQRSDSLPVMENELLEQYNSILKEDPFQRMEKASAFYDQFASILLLESSFDYSFDSLKNIGSIYSDDHRIRFITWNIPYGYNENLYFGIVQYYDKHEKNYRVIRLNDKVKKGREGIKTEWDGALYYAVVETKHAGQRYYTLLGFDLYSPFSNRKTIDVVSIDDFDEFYFCLSLINYQGKQQDRLTFEYNEKAIMSLQYNPDLKMIIFDHLSPSRPSLEGKFEFYGPDFTYDGLKWEKGTWVFYSNIDVTN